MNIWKHKLNHASQKQRHFIRFKIDCDPFY